MMVFCQVQYRLSLAKVGTRIDTNSVVYQKFDNFDVTLSCSLEKERCDIGEEE